MATQTISLSTSAHDTSVGYNELSTAEKNTIPIVRHVITESEAAGSAMVSELCYAKYCYLIICVKYI